MNNSNNLHYKLVFQQLGMLLLVTMNMKVVNKPVVSVLTNNNF